MGMMLPEPSSQVLAVRFGLVVGEREWSEEKKRSECQSAVRSGSARSREPDGSGRRLSLSLPLSGTSGRGAERIGHGAATFGPGECIGNRRIATARIHLAAQ